MSMLKQDPLTGRWVIIAAGRSARPNEFPAQVRDKSPRTDCPFCLGNEDQTPPEILALGRNDDQPANGPGWHLRALPNMYPALVPTDSVAPFGLQEGLPATLFGFHGDPSLNIVIHSATVDRTGADEGADSFHWHLEVLPRLSRAAGFEVGTGYTINSVVPEDVARGLRGEGV